MHRRLSVRCARAVAAVVALLTLLSILGGSAPAAATAPAAWQATPGDTVLDDTAALVTRPLTTAGRSEDVTRSPAAIGVDAGGWPVPGGWVIPFQRSFAVAAPLPALHLATPRRGPPNLSAD